MSFLRLSGVRKAFGAHVAVHDFGLEVAQGELVSFLGPSGCGKTTTLRMIAGFEQPTEGTIEIDGDDVTRRPPNRRDVGMVFQSYALFPNMSVADNIAFGLRMRGESKDRIRRRVVELLELIHLPDAGPRYPYQLSGGMQQRVALARALAIEPRVLLLDEPLSALDAKIRMALRSEIRAIQQRLRITTVYVTHDQEEALSLSDRVVVMSEGRIEQVGTPAEIYDRPATGFVARFVGTLNLLGGKVVDASSGQVMVGKTPVRSAGVIPDRPAGSQVMLALRPESVTLDADGGDASSPSRSRSDQDAGEHEGVNRFTGRVRGVSFLGSIVRLSVAIDEDRREILVDRFTQPGVPPPVVGDAVHLLFPPEALIVLPDASDDQADSSPQPGRAVPASGGTGDAGAH
jgi:putative spermidine/putrescine transport system ATP-binding protein